jgi:SM-20-related protein
MNPSSSGSRQLGFADRLTDRGWAVEASFLPSNEVNELGVECTTLWERGEFRRASVGRGPSLRLDPAVRNDWVRWVDPTRPTPAQKRYLNRMEALRLALNQALYLGLLHFEAHLSLYPRGSYYRAHLDRFKDAPHRALSCVLYLNDTWRPGDGGQLRLYVGGDKTGAYEDILPHGGTLVLFFSERFYHEVLPPARERFSITGWFGKRP